MSLPPSIAAICIREWATTNEGQCGNADRMYWFAQRIAAEAARLQREADRDAADAAAYGKDVWGGDCVAPLVVSPPTAAETHKE